MQSEVKSTEQKFQDMKNLFKSITTKGSEKVPVQRFPTEWHKFFDHKEEYIKGVDLPEDETSVMCLYHSKEAGTFGKHVHACEENILMLRGKATIIINPETPDEERIRLKVGDSIKIEAKVDHDAYFVADTLFSVTWIVNEGESLTFDFDNQ